MIQPGTSTVATVNTRLNTKAKRSIMVIDFFREERSRIPQNRDVNTEAPIPMPIQKIMNRLINCPAKEEADSCASPMELSMTVSMRLIPTVIIDCREMGTAIFNIFRYSSLSPQQSRRRNFSVKIKILSFHAKKKEPLGEALLLRLHQINYILEYP